MIDPRGAVTGVKPRPSAGYTRVTFENATAYLKENRGYVDTVFYADPETSAAQFIEACGHGEIRATRDQDLSDDGTVLRTIVRQYVDPEKRR